MTGVLPEEVMFKVLEAHALAGGATGWGLSYGTMPDGSTINDKYVTVNHYGDELSGRLMKTGEQTTHYSIQVMLRTPNNLFKDGKLKIEAIRETLTNVKREVVTLAGPINVMVHSFTATTGIFPMGQEPEGERRHLFSLNGLVALSLAE